MKTSKSSSQEWKLPTVMTEQSRKSMSWTRVRKSEELAGCCEVLRSIWKCFRLENTLKMLWRFVDTELLIDHISALNDTVSRTVQKRWFQFTQRSCKEIQTRVRKLTQRLVLTSTGGGKELSGSGLMACQSWDCGKRKSALKPWGIRSSCVHRQPSRCSWGEPTH